MTGAGDRGPRALPPIPHMEPAFGRHYRPDDR